VYQEHPFPFLALFLVFVVARYMQWGDRRDIFATIRIEFTLGLLLGVICTGLLMMRPVNLLPARRVMIAIILLFFAMLVQLPFAADRISAQTIFVDRVLKFAMMTYFMIVLLQSPRYMTFFMYAFLFSCFYITQESVRGLISGGLVWENQGVLRLHGAVSMYRHPNSLGGLAMGAVPFCVFLLPVWRRWYLRGGLLALLGLALTVVLYTGSRTAYVAFLAFLLYWWFVSKQKLRWLVVGAVAGAIALVFIPQQYKERFMSIGGQEAEGRSRELRIEILQDALTIFMENPGGVGIASFPAVRMQRFGRFQDTHNLYLEVATNLGVQGLVVFLFLVAIMIVSYRRAYLRFSEQRRALAPWRRRPDLPVRLRRAVEGLDDDLAAMMAIAVAAAGFIYVRLALGLFGMDLYEVYWWFGAGLAITLLNMTVSVDRNGRRLLEACRAHDAGSGPAASLA
jgi:O-antigen ligase